MSGRTSRNKGANYERQVANLFNQAGYPEAQRGLGQCRDAGEVSDVTGVPGLWIECKKHRLVSIPAAMKQAQDACPADQTPIVVSMNDRDQTLVTMRWADWIRWYASVDGAPQEDPPTLDELLDGE